MNRMIMRRAPREGSASLGEEASFWPGSLDGAILLSIRLHVREGLEMGTGGEVKLT